MLRFILRTICSWSGGKDSTATIILAHIHNIPIDLIIFSEVMFDLKNGISGENPEHIRFMREVAIPKFREWGYEVVEVRAEKDYLDHFYSVIENPRKNMEHKGMRRGFPLPQCAIRRDLKQRPVEQYIKSLGTDVVQLLGMCIDEPKRLESMHKEGNKRSLLEEYNYTEEKAKELCMEYGLYSPGYELSKRGGCWMCPFAKVEEHRAIRKLNRKAWDRFVALEDEPNVAHSVWNIYGESLKKREELFRLEDEMNSAKSSVFSIAGTRQKAAVKTAS